MSCVLFWEVSECPLSLSTQLANYTRGGSKLSQGGAGGGGGSFH